MRTKKKHWNKSNRTKNTIDRTKKNNRKRTKEKIIEREGKKTQIRERALPLYHLAVIF
jgi:hypothetical protein